MPAEQLTLFALACVDFISADHDGSCRRCGESRTLHPVRRAPTTVSASAAPAANVVPLRNIVYSIMYSIDDGPLDRVFDDLDATNERDAAVEAEAYLKETWSDFVERQRECGERGRIYAHLVAIEYADADFDEGGSKEPFLSRFRPSLHRQKRIKPSRVAILPNRS